MFGPLTFMSCQDCQEHGAEPSWFVDHVARMFDTVERFLSWQPPVFFRPVADSAKVFVEGRYMTVRDWTACP